MRRTALWAAVLVPLVDCRGSLLGWNDAWFWHPLRDLRVLACQVEAIPADECDEDPHSCALQLGMHASCHGRSPCRGRGCCCWLLWLWLVDKMVNIL